MFTKFFRGVWNSLNFIRRLILNGIVLALIVLIVSGIWQGFQSQMPENPVLVIAPWGALVEQWEGDPIENAIGEALGEENPQTRVFDLVQAIRAAASDSNIPAIVLKTDGLYSASPAQLQELAQALAVFRAAGKPVYAFGTSFSQSQYYLAAQADRIYLDPMGQVVVDGFGIWQNYYAEAADKLKASVNVFRVGEFKSAVEPWIRNDMSPAAKEANQVLLGAMWDSWTQAISERRQVSPIRLESYAQDFNQLLAASEGDAALTAIAAGLVDQLATPLEFREAMVQEFGQDSESDWGDYTQISVAQYGLELDLQALQQQAVEPPKTIAVVAIQGALMEGARGVGYADVEAAIDQLWRASHDDNVAAIVVRVDSPGGTITAAESLRRAVVDAQQEGKPVLVSMGGVAASGGYWLAANADQIWAQPDSLTGSIGIFGIVPTFENSLRELGIHTDGVGTSPFAGGFRVDRALAEPVRESIQLYIEQGYRRFINTVAEGRKLETDAVEAAAQGRVWVGSAAHELALVDYLGGLQDTIEAAAELVDINDYQVELMSPRLAFYDEVLLSFIGGLVGYLPANVAAWLKTSLWLQSELGSNPVLQLVQQAQQQQLQLQLNDVGLAWWAAELR